ncbi:cytochrome d ubiquinol oxidase subunit II [Spongiimicrobium salis]|uniref:cytochrome d ubiquinol oxidase subunit II n=1 Tax=Spongiimicrobium salis TaxID=1667022 RepID=UPI00374D8940
MIYVVLFFLGFSLFLYVLMAGADFGAGILELFSSKKNQSITKKTAYRVMGPVWEANHIWIIILIVILWIGFPIYYNILVLSLHIPITLMLLGITLRGVAFIFRHYDVYKDQSQRIYDFMFRLSSLLTPVFIGLTFGAVVSGEITRVSEVSELSFAQLYIAPWWNIFSLLIGLFFTALCAFLASVFLIGEASSATKKYYIKKAIIALVVVVLLGFSSIVFGYFSQIPFVLDFIQNPYCILAVLFSGVLLVPLWRSIHRGRRILSRLYVGVQVVLILFAALATNYPYLIYTTENQINILTHTAPDSVISVLGVSLLIGGFVILPGLFHLLKSFKMIKILEQ